MRTEWPANSSLGELTLFREVPLGGKSEGSSRVVVEGDAIATIPSRTLIISRLSSSIITRPTRMTVVRCMQQCLRAFQRVRPTQKMDFSNQLSTLSHDSKKLCTTFCIFCLSLSLLLKYYPWYIYILYIQLLSLLSLLTSL